MTLSTTQSRTAGGPGRDLEIAISVENVTKKFGGFTAVKDLDLNIRSGEFFSMLGPSGSGKTTVLRMIAGFELPTAGTIKLGGTDVTHRAPFDRDVNTVFQDYALFPHLTVAQNVAYGLNIRKIAKAERKRLVEEALAMVRLPDMADRAPANLSGGQRQRVALARALVLRPQVLLLDEPLGALDKQLREEMQTELKQIQRDVGITFVFVTHDQEEALTLSDRVAVFNNGKVEQIGTPEDLYERPASRFVAGFLGTTNLVQGELAKQINGGDSLLSIRPERIHIRPLNDPAGADDCTIEAVIEDAVYTGPTTRYVARTDSGETLTIHEHNDVRATHTPRGTRVRLTWSKKFNYTV